MRRKHRTAWIVLSTMLTLAAGEARLAVAGPLPSREAGRDVSAASLAARVAARPPGATASVDDLLSAVAAQVPTFGGMYLSHGVLQIYLVDTRQAAAAEAAIAAVFGRDRVDVSNARVLTAKYTFAQLKGWHDRHRLATLAVRGVVMTDIHKSSNRLRVGVATTDVTRAVQTGLANAGIPTDAAEIVVMQPIAPFDTLLDTHRPLVGGLQIANDGGGGCTLGFLAVLQGQAGFLTCSHCTDVQGGVEGTVIHQSTVMGSLNRVGVETADPLYFSGSGCPSGRQCRFSDSAFIARNGGPSQSVPRAAADFGRIAFTDSTLTIFTDFEIGAKVMAPIDGELVSKVGKTSGLTGGTISDTCTDINENGTNKTILCQDLVQETDTPVAGPGDSGSAVFSTNGTPQSDLPPAILFGLLWGGNGTSFAFSPLGALQMELGSLKAFPADAGANSPPEVKIRQPFSFSHVGVGGSNFVDFLADIVDYEGCCSDVTWTSDKDGVIGHGATPEFTFQSAGTRTITVTATDNNGGTASDSIQITAGTSPPSVSIVKPTAAQILYTGVTNVFSGTSLDPNEPFFSMPCSDLVWTSSKAGDPFPVTGCNPQVTFQTVGVRNLTLTGTDSLGLAASATVGVSVQTAPVTNPPTVTITNPLDDYLLPAATIVTLTGTAQDPGNQSPLTYQWVLADGPVHTVLGSGSVNNGGQITFPWKPSDNVGFNCGGEPVTLELDVTNPGGKTGFATVDVLVGYPPC
jgi:hypothetical protein